MSDYALDQKLADAAPKAASDHVPIVETFRGEVIWEGIVNEYLPAKRQHVYAWAVESEHQKSQYIAVLKQPPITSPLDAVRAWIVSQARKQ